ncbi:MAG: UDP-N-acetylmuramoyl-L-alanyl-D-glutamate--2,6-diaminopimelate ligase [Candidatus Marinimicrobia bacterium]|jgi:UDP-N-acetylmuramoyl-L-alanyl-D-glutamate--2,6-diaminopimelate ligase|nr:UDP-N-acetylmuramoyl-L-alanyl-D-glutamate--2,6-diaminopimelate ligase [Candidatus Neomarinimicrobiota bacterium]MBT3574691.1 UDP-N-acetylmuramoyl-L-alanyl-D-glutamate--2,6-diaminopimelate ligase [Candidatus Neomarinimicrobiota bacterium]MBT3681203.1 UDP-N-acetylmuramoyl-L-alanyl-D-glutamate--2,6-diaminopimelate ligase [Candidatus Neomarinimicrobiota bacterium]MBT3951972.1 UDP-N-acetylmuramoyl-L-alanyl-D-glutamate--2,6-diaminopimelate ligase [Candidatus Neomarinimicrobiota bacterium]MBT425254
MQLTNIINQVPDILEAGGDLKTEVTGISYDSRQVQQGHLFIAVRGLITDGHDFIYTAIENGAQVIVYDRSDFVIPENIVSILVQDSRLALPVIASTYFGHPEEGLKLVAITGTNGKTTTNYFVQHLLDKSGSKAGRIGTTGAQMDDVDIDLMHTTPESANLYEILAEFVAHGAKAVTLEVSSHALSQNRVDGLTFDVAVYTNLTQDHLDYHGSLEDYLAAKQLLFKGLPKESVAIVNMDDPHAERIIEVCVAKIIRYGYNSNAEYRILDHSINRHGVELTLDTPYGQRVVQVNTVGTFNYYNFLAAYAAAIELECDIEKVELSAKSLPMVPGRLEKIVNQAPFQVFVDYAHTPDAMKTVLSTLAESYPDNRLITVFGCGGDRDKGKRPIMGEIATRLSSKAIITDDNPRTEAPLNIIQEIIAGCGERSNYSIIQDRTEAINAALLEAEPGDIVAVLGKGHEPYQEIMGERKPFSDMTIVDQFMEQHGYSA